MSAPTPTSALVHSSTLVTAGLIIIVVYRDLLLDSYILLVLLVVGSLTMLAGSLLALVETSVKKVVAYSTLSQIGLGTTILGLGCVYAGIVNLVSHGLAKRLLFIQVGYLIHLRMGQQNVRRWHIRRYAEGLMRIQLICTLFSLSGTIFFGGIRRKEVILVLIVERKVYFFLLLIIVFTIFLTFFYRVLIYKRLINFCLAPVRRFRGSSIVLFITYSEVFVVVVHFS